MTLRAERPAADGEGVSAEHFTRAAERLIRRFARETNLLIAGRPVCVVRRGGGSRVGADRLAERLERMLRACGARDGRAGDTGLIEFDLTGASDPVAQPESVPIRLDGEPLPDRGDAAGRIAFARERMLVSAAFAQRLDVEGVRIGVAMVLEPKTAVLALLLRSAGAIVSVYAHPDEIDLGVAEALRAHGIAVSGDPALLGAEERAAALAFLRGADAGRGTWTGAGTGAGPDDAGLDVLLDDGAHLIRLAHEDLPEHVARWIGACEETTSGLTPLRAMARAGLLRTAVMAVNDAATKTRFDNRYGTGQSCVFAIADALDAAGESVRNRPAVVVGYGPVGAGVAAYLRALGAVVSVVERDPVRALEALHAGFVVARLDDCVDGALVVSATGVPGTIPARVLARAAVVAVAGGVPGEIVEAAPTDEEPANTTPAPAPRARILGGGGAINITAAEGNPIEIMDLSFAVQLAALDRLVRVRPGVGVHALPAHLDDEVARQALRARGIPIDPAHAVATPESSDWRSPRYLATAPGEATR